jgi:hypothetical protein
MNHVEQITQDLKQFMSDTLTSYKLIPDVLQVVWGDGTYMLNVVVKGKPLTNSIREEEFEAFKESFQIWAEKQAANQII